MNDIKLHIILNSDPLTWTSLMVVDKKFNQLLNNKNTFLMFNNSPDFVTIINTSIDHYIAKFPNLKTLFNVKNHVINEWVEYNAKITTHKAFLYERNILQKNGFSNLITSSILVKNYDDWLFNIFEKTINKFLIKKIRYLNG